MTVWEELKARGLIAQVTDEDEIKEMVNNGKVPASLSTITSANPSQPTEIFGTKLQDVFT